MKSILLVMAASLLGLLPDTGRVEDHTYQLVVFEGSDWCANCRRLEKNILNDAEVQDYLKKNNIEIIRVDFPQRKKLSRAQEQQNEELAEKYGFTGRYPEIVLSKSTGTSFDKILYKNETTKEFITAVQKKLKSLE